MTVVLRVLLFLLKCIGILLLAILGLLLLVTVLVLFAPVRYRGKLKKREAPEEIFRAEGLISWLNPLLRVRIRYTEKKLHYTVRLFGICLMNSDKPKKEKKQKKKDKKEKSERAEKEKPSSDEGLTETETVGKKTEPENTESEAAEKKMSLFAKMKKLFEKIKGIPAVIKKKITKLINTGKLLWYKKEKVVAFFEDELHKVALGSAWDTVKQMLRHILPGKVKGYVEFGTGDPASTGKALGALGVLYAWYGKGVTVVPDFYEKRVVADLGLKGRIRGGTLLLKGLRLIRDKQVKRLYRNFKRLLTVLKQKAE